MSKIILKNIEKTLNGATILHQIHLVVEEGEVLSLLGPSGCGKTTTLKVIAGLLSPDKGEVFLGEENITGWPAEKRGTVIVFQDHLLFPHLNVEENIGFGLKMARKPKFIIREKVEEMLELVKLKGMNKKYPHMLSGGQKQRVALARALAVGPKVLLLDEPFSNLDIKLREEMRDLTLDIQRSLKVTTVLVTHDREEALMSSHKIAIMLDGEIKQVASPKELYTKPNSIEVANFLGEKNYIYGYVRNGNFLSDFLQIETRKEDVESCLLMVKPEEIKLLPSGSTELEGIIVASKYAGERTYYTVLVNEQEWKVISQNETAYHGGDKVSIDFELQDPVIFEC